MADVDCDWKGDFSLTPSGDLALVDGNDMVEQLIVRRLLTAVQRYVFHPSYGAGLPQRIGRPAVARNIQSIVLSQIYLEATVKRVPLPTAAVTPLSAGLYAISVSYTSALTGKAIEIQLEVPGSQ